MGFKIYLTEKQLDVVLKSLINEEDKIQDYKIQNKLLITTFY